MGLENRISKETHLKPVIVIASNEGLIDMKEFHHEMLSKIESKTDKIIIVF